jgi:hypothetical protein
MPLFYHAPVWNERRTNEKLFYSNRPSGRLFCFVLVKADSQENQERILIGPGAGRELKAVRFGPVV